MKVVSGGGSTATLSKNSSSEGNNSNSADGDHNKANDILDQVSNIEEGFGDDISRDGQSSASGSGNGVSTAGSGTTAMGSSTSGRISRKDPGIRLVRFSVFFVLLAAAAIVSAFVFMNAKGSQTGEFELRWGDQSTHLMHAFKDEVSSKLQSLDGFAITIQSHALLENDQSGSTWPLVEVPEFHYRASSTILTARSEGLTMIPRVETNEKAMWEEYSVNNQGWRQEAYEFQLRFPDAYKAAEGGHGGHRMLEETMSPEDTTHTMEPDRDMDMGKMNNTMDGMDGGPSMEEVGYIEEFIWRVEDKKLVPETNSGPYYPVWQHAPIHPGGAGWVNFNLAGVEMDLEAIRVVEKTHMAVVGKSFNFAKADHGYVKKYENFVLLIPFPLPIFNTLNLLPVSFCEIQSQLP